MHNDIVYKITSKVKVKISGRKVEYFLKKLVASRVELLDIKQLNRKELVIEIYKRDYEKVLALKSIYDIKIVDYKGLVKFKKLLGINKFLIIFGLVGLAILFYLSNVIFSVEVIHNDKELRNLITKELSNYGIEPKKIKKDFQEIEKIKKSILNKHKDKIEWLEIENVGTKYIVKVEERKIVDIKQDYTKRNIIATKSAIIKKVFAKNGVILRNVNDYVKAGDTVISGEIKLNEEVKATIKAEGEIYGEVWYTVKVEYPYIYSEKKTTGKTKDVLVFHFLNNEFELFNFNKYKNKIKEDHILLKHMFLPIYLSKQTQREVEVVEYVATIEEAINLALEKSRKELENKLDEEEYIINEKQLKADVKDDKVVLEVFYAVYENITGYAEIKEEVAEE